ncbi:MAG TPA: hypothetical protein VMT34_18695 [Aggregatilineales bacterium]|nr:hypothetical protein [Aggregatilineales bacterium]
MPTLLTNPRVRRAILSGLTTGFVVIFLILIGVPGGASDADGLPAWFAWGMFMLIALIFGRQAVRARNIREERSQTPLTSIGGGLVVGVIAAVLVVAAMCAINAAQLWELHLTPESSQYSNGLNANVTRVQDVLANVTPRTTAVMSGLPLDAIKPPGNTPRSDPTMGFILMACLLPVASTAGGALSWFLHWNHARRAAGPAVTPGQRRALWRRWLVVILPLLFFAFIVLNAVLPGSGGSIGSAYKDLIGANAQLAGLLATFFLIASGLFAIRENAPEQRPQSFAVRAGLLLALTLALVLVGLAAPANDPGNLIFTQRIPGLRQITGPDGTIRVISDIIEPVSTDTLISLRKLYVVAVGVLFASANLAGARGERPLRSLFAMNALLGTLAIMPLYLDTYQQSVLLLVGINILLGLGLNIVVGYAGLLDLGYVAFFAIGSYTYAFLSSNQAIRVGQEIVSLKYGGNDQVVATIAMALVISLVVVPIVMFVGLSWWQRRVATNPGARAASGSSQASAGRPAWLSYALVTVSVVISLLVIGLIRGTPFYDSFNDFPAFIIGLLVGVVVAGTAGVLLGIPVLRLRGDYLAIVTLGFGEIIRLFLNNLQNVTGGPQGVLNIPRAGFGNVEIGSNEGLLIMVTVGCLLVAFLSLRLKSSRLGRAWGALRSDEDIAQAMGVNLVASKVLAFAIGAAFAGIGGVIFAARQGSIFPDNYTFDVSINVLSLIIIGGMGSVPGVVLGALVLIGVPESLRVFANYRVMAFGALLVAMMVLRPTGLLPEEPAPMEQRARLLASKETVS